MRLSTTTVEIGGTVDEQGQLHLDAPMLSINPGRVRVILVPEQDDIDEQDWLRAAARSQVFDFLDDPAEDIYTAKDGKPFRE